MSEVLRLRLVDTNGYPATPVDDCIPGDRWVSEEDFDRVTAERDAALSSLDSADASAQTLHEVISRLKSERDDTQACLDLSIGREDALQQRLTAADERADVLETEVARLTASEDRWYQESINLTVERDTLRARLSRALELLRGTHTGDLFGPDDWETVDAFLNLEAKP